MEKNRQSSRLWQYAKEAMVEMIAATFVAGLVAVPLVSLTKTGSISLEQAFVAWVFATGVALYLIVKRPPKGATWRWNGFVLVLAPLALGSGGAFLALWYRAHTGS